MGGGGAVQSRAVRYHATCRPSSIPIRLGTSHRVSQCQWHCQWAPHDPDRPDRPGRGVFKSESDPATRRIPRRFAGCLLPAAPWRARAAGGLSDLSSTVHTEGTWSRTGG
jgi:hypothetical protein